MPGHRTLVESEPVADDTSARPPSKSPRARAGGEERRQALVKAAFSLIAERGMENLRTREIADRVGVNVATLHYYFATKDDLIDAVDQYAGEQFAIEHAPRLDGSDVPWIQRIRQEFADVWFYRTERPELIAVALELSLRARRSGTESEVTSWVQEGHRASVRQLMQDGQAQGALRPDLGLDDAVAIFFAFQFGIGQTARDRGEFDRACAEIERWLTGATSTR